MPHKVTLLVHCNVLFGVHVLPMELLEAGYTVIQRPLAWTKARKDGRDYFIKVRGRTLELWPCRYDGERTERNPLGEYLESEGKPEVIKLK